MVRYAQPVLLAQVVQVRELVSLLMDTRHNGFPVVENAGVVSRYHDRVYFGFVVDRRTDWAAIV